MKIVTLPAMLIAAAVFAGCGVETAAVVATQAEASAEAAKEAKKTQEKIEQDIAALQQASADARAAADE